MDPHIIQHLPVTFYPFIGSPLLLFFGFFLADFSALESILISITTALDVEMAVLRKFVNELLTQLETDIDRERLRNMLIYSKKLSAFEKKATLIRDALAEVLDNGQYPFKKKKKARFIDLFR